MPEQLTFDGFDLSSGFTCDICKDQGTVKFEGEEGLRACIACDLGIALCCENAACFGIELSAAGLPLPNQARCQSCGEWYIIDDDIYTLIKFIDESWGC